MTERKSARSSTAASWWDSEPSGGTAADADTHKSVFKGVPWWIYVAAGVVVVGAATGGIYAYTQASKPVSGTANVSW